MENNYRVSSSPHFRSPLTTGQVKISYRIGRKTYKASGVIYRVGSQSKLYASGTFGGEPFVIAVE